MLKAVYYNNFVFSACVAAYILYKNGWKTLTRQYLLGTLTYCIILLGY